LDLGGWKAFSEQRRSSSRRGGYSLLNSNTPLTQTTKLRRIKADLSKRGDKAKQKDTKYREAPDIVVKVICRYRAELFFKISRKTKLSRLISSWTERMERAGGNLGDTKGIESKNGFVQSETANTQHSGSSASNLPIQFMFTFNGRSIEADQTFEDIGIDDDDEILAVELMDLTEGGGGSGEWVRLQILDMIR
jgi:hypothetical protein